MISTLLLYRTVLYVMWARRCHVSCACDENAFNLIYSVGADIPMMKDMNYYDMMKNDFSLLWNKVYDFRKPILAAVNGFCVSSECTK